MFGSSLTYFIYILTNNQDNTKILYIGSGILGFGASCLWVSQSIYITLCSNNYEKSQKIGLNSKLGYFNGIFYSLFQFKSFLGNFIAAIIFAKNKSETNQNSTKNIMYVMMSIITFIGSLVFCLLRPFDIEYQPLTNNSNNINDGT